MARKPGKKQKEIPVGCTGKGKRLKGNIREGLREYMTGTVLELSLEITLVRLLFDDNEIEMARKPGKKQKENPVGCTGECKRGKGTIFRV